MTSDNIIEEAIAYINALFRGNAGGHDAGHTLRVYHNAMRISEGESGCDREIVALTALLHDADDRKLFLTENNANARAFLEAGSVGLGVGGGLANKRAIAEGNYAKLTEAARTLLAAIS